MVFAVSSAGTAASASKDTGSQLAVLQRQLTALQKQLTTLQEGEDSAATQQQTMLVAQQIALIEAQIAALQAAAAQKAIQQDARTAGSAPSNPSLTSGSVIDTVA